LMIWLIYASIIAVRRSDSSSIVPSVSVATKRETNDTDREGRLRLTSVC
jgi:hypothetical protein